MPWFTDHTWHAKKLFLSWRVVECDSDVVYTQDAWSRLRSSGCSGDQHSCHFRRWRHRVVTVAFLLECCNFHGDLSFSNFLASVVVQPLCTDELLPDGLTLRNFVEDVMVHHLLHFSLATLRYLFTDICFHRSLDSATLIRRLALAHQSLMSARPKSVCRCPCWCGWSAIHVRLLSRRQRYSERAGTLTDHSSKNLASSDGGHLRTGRPSPNRFLS